RGTTRRALAAAERVRDSSPDGVWLVALASLPADPSPDPTAMATATLAALGQREQPGQDPLDTLVAHLQAKRLPVLLGFSIIDRVGAAPSSRSAWGPWAWCCCC